MPKRAKLLGIETWLLSDFPPHASLMFFLIRGTKNAFIKEIRFDALHLIEPSVAACSNAQTPDLTIARTLSADVQSGDGHEHGHECGAQGRD